MCVWVRAWPWCDQEGVPALRADGCEMWAKRTADSVKFVQKLREQEDAKARA
jgi:hypothetical protein